MKCDAFHSPGKSRESSILLAAGIGGGLRVDVSYFVFRFDVAFPVRYPNQEHIDLESIELGNSGWRKQNLTYNLAIGYPF